VTLFWSERGEIACEKHIPYRGSDTWKWERWKEMRAAEVAAFAQQSGKSAKCDCCWAIERVRKEEGP